MGTSGVGNGRSKGLFRKNPLFFSHWSTRAGREQSKTRQERPADAGTGEPCGEQEMPLDLAQKQLPQEPKTGLGAWENPETCRGVRRRDCWAVVCW